MVNINDLDVKLILINEFTIFENGSVMFDISYCKENNTPHVVFNTVEYIFKKSSIYSYLIFSETEKNKKMLDKYVKIIDQIREEILFIEDKNRDFVMDKDFMTFRFKTNDNLPCNQKINVIVCVISISGVFEEKNWYYPQIEFQDCFDESSEN